MHPLAKSIINKSSDWKLWVLCDRDPVENWVDGRVTLLGDAAHPMLQYMAQGACMAMEDAVCLSNALGKNALGRNAPGKQDIKAALEQYQRQRIVRTARVTLASRQMGDDVYHPHGTRAQVRNSILQSWSQAEYYHRLDWLYGGMGEAEINAKE